MLLYTIQMINSAGGIFVCRNWQADGLSPGLNNNNVCKVACTVAKQNEIKMFYPLHTPFLDIYVHIHFEFTEL